MVICHTFVVRFSQERQGLCAARHQKRSPPLPVKGNEGDFGQKNLKKLTVNPSFTRCRYVRCHWLSCSLLKQRGHMRQDCPLITLLYSFSSGFFSTTQSSVPIERSRRIRCCCLPGLSLRDSMTKTALLGGVVTVSSSLSSLYGI